jgi:hypothetical protein
MSDATLMFPAMGNLSEIAILRQLTSWCAANCPAFIDLTYLWP